MEIDDMPEPFEDDLEEFERNQVAADHEGEDLELEDQRPLEDSEEDTGALEEEVHHGDRSEESVERSPGGRRFPRGVSTKIRSLAARVARRGGR